jgi:uncharacterized membrane protein HdeD (DUF308 family)
LVSLSDSTVRRIQPGYENRKSAALACNHPTFEVRLLRFVKEDSMAQNTPVDLARQASTVSIVWGILLVIFGMVAVGSPFLAAVVVSTAVAWLIVLAGVVHLMLGVRAHGAGSMIWKLLVGLAYLVFGVYLIVHPRLGVASLTLVLASLFLIEGVLDLILFFKMRPIGGSSWVLVDGIITLLLGLMIYMQWPSSAAWAIGTLVGVSMIVSGITRVMLSLAVRRATGSLSSSSSSLAA